MGRTVAIYARVSTAHEEQIYALGNQVQYYDNLLSMHPDWVLYDRYIDEGITGTSIKKRKNFVRMINDAEEGKFNLIITREVSRFARNTVDTLQETRNLKKIGVEVYFTEDNIWTFTQDDGELKLAIMATLAQNESRKTSQRVKAGQTISFQNGVFYGTGNILGYDKVGRDLIVNEEQAKTVKFIFESYLKGNGITKIKDDLEKKGMITSTGLSMWHLASILRVLKNPFYCGTIVYRKYYIPDYLEQKPKKNNGEVEQVVVEGRHTPLISKEDYNKVQEMLKQNSTNKINKRGTNTNCIWVKKLKCKCGKTFNRKKYHKYQDKITYCYQCYNQLKTGSYAHRLKSGLSTVDICDTPLIQEWKLKLSAYFVFDRICSQKDDVLKITNKFLDDAISEAENRNQYDEDIEHINKKLDTLTKKKDMLIETYISEMISKEDYIKKKNEIEEKIKLEEENLKFKKDKMGVSASTVKERVSKLKKDIKNNLNYKKDDFNETWINTFVEKIVISNDSYDWYLNYLNDILSFTKEKNNNKKILLGRFVITKDDVYEYSKYDEELKRVRLKQPMEIDIYI